MKRLRLIIIICFMLSLTGCIQEYSAAEQQNDAVAEYMAGLLLKYDEDYEQGLTKMSEIQVESTTTDMDIDTPTPTADQDDDSTVNSDGPEVVTQKDYTLTEVIGEKDFDIQFTGYQITDTYPEDIESTYFSLTPRVGNQLLVASFSVLNNTGSEKALNLSKAKIIYQLDINVGTIYKPSLTLLENDLQYIDIAIKGGKTKTVLLIFEVSKDKDIAEINLVISKDNKSEIIKVK